MNREHARQHHAGYVKVSMIKTHGLFIGGRCLNRDVALNMRITFCRILKHGEVGQDQRIGAQLCCHIHGALPAGIAIRMGKGIDGNVQFAPVLVNEVNGFLKLFLRKVKTRKMAGVGIIFQPDIDRIGPIFDGRLKRRKVSGRAEQLHNLSRCCRSQGS